MTTSQQLGPMLHPESRRPRRSRPALGTVVAVAVGTISLGAVGITLAHDNSREKPERSRTEDAALDPASESASPTSSPTTRPPATSQEGLTSASRLSLDGIGPVDIGMTLDQASAAAGMPFRLLDTPAGPECRYAVPDRSSRMGDELAFMVVNGRIARIDVGIMGPDLIRTVSGIGKGSTEAEVLTTYRGRIRVEPHPYRPGGRYLVYVPNDASLRHLSMIFETVDGEVRAFRAGLAEQVSWTEGCA